MANKIVHFPTGRSGPFQEAADYYLDACYPDLSEDERVLLKAQVVEIADKYNLPRLELNFPADLFPDPEHPELVKQAIESQLLPPFQKVFGDMLTEIFFLRCYSFSLERALAKKTE